MFHYLLQTATSSAAAEQFSADSLRADTQQLVEKLSTTTPSELIAELGREAIQFGLKLLAALLIYIIGAWIIRLVKRAVSRGFARKGTDGTVSSFVNSIISIMLWVILIIIMVGTLGINTTSLAALLAAGGMAIGMALGGTVQNFAGGLMLLVFKPFKAGDFIEAQGYSGTVSAVNMVSTKLTTLDNRVIYIPNGALSNGNINNYSTQERRRVDLEISVSYGSDAEKVKSVIRSVLAENPSVLGPEAGAPEPFVRLLRLNTSSVDFVIRAWTSATEYWNVYFYLTETLYKRLPEEGISFPFPQLDVHLKNKN